jgi:hypothetical protein
VFDHHIVDAGDGMALRSRDCIAQHRELEDGGRTFRYYDI